MGHGNNQGDHSTNNQVSITWTLLGGFFSDTQIPEHYTVEKLRLGRRICFWGALAAIGGLGGLLFATHGAIEAMAPDAKTNPVGMSWRCATTLIVMMTLIGIIVAMIRDIARVGARYEHRIAELNTPKPEASNLDKLRAELAAAEAEVARMEESRTANA